MYEPREYGVRNTWYNKGCEEDGDFCVAVKKVGGVAVFEQSCGQQYERDADLEGAALLRKTIKRG